MTDSANSKTKKIKLREGVEFYLITICDQDGNIKRIDVKGQIENDKFSFDQADAGMFFYAALSIIIEQANMLLEKGCCIHEIVDRWRGTRIFVDGNIDFAKDADGKNLKVSGPLDAIARAILIEEDLRCQPV